MRPRSDEKRQQNRDLRYQSPTIHNRPHILKFLAMPSKTPICQRKTAAHHAARRPALPCSLWSIDSQLPIGHLWRLPQQCFTLVKWPSDGVTLSRQEVLGSHTNNLPPAQWQHSLLLPSSFRQPPNQIIRLCYPKATLVSLCHFLCLMSLRLRLHGGVRGNLGPFRHLITTQLNELLFEL